MWIEKLENGKFKFIERYLDPYSEKWKKVSVTLDKKNQREAQRILEKKIQDKSNKIQNRAITLHELMDKWLQNYKMKSKNSSYFSRVSHIKKLKKSISHEILVKNIDRVLLIKQIEEWLFVQDLSRNYVKELKNVLNMLFKYAIDMQYIQTNPLNNIQIPTKKVEVKHIKEKYLEKDEVEMILDNLRNAYGNKKNKRIADLCEFLYLNGLRIGEALALEWSEIDFENRTIAINGTWDYHYNNQDFARKTSTKTAQSKRTISFNERTNEILHEIQAENPKEVPYIFIGLLSHRQLTVQVISSNLRNATKRIGLNKRVSPHTFRHSHISRLAELHLPVAAIMERVGHADSKTTLEIYTHVTNKMREEIIEKIELL